MRCLWTTVLVSVCLPAAATEPTWHDDYAAAFRQARGEGRLLLVAFHDESQPFVLPEEAAGLLEGFVLADVPTSTTLLADGGATEAKPLLGFRAFRELGGKPGLAVVNLARTDQKYRQVIATLGMEEANRGAAAVMRLIEQSAVFVGKGAVVDRFGLAWHTDYAAAYRQAKEQQKLLFLACDSDEIRFSPDRETAGRLRDLVLVRLSLDECKRLLCDTGLRKFHCSEGVGVVDLKHQGPNRGQLVNTIPARCLTMRGVRAMIELAEGEAESQPLKWHDDYLEARAAAEREGKMLLVAVDSDEAQYTPRTVNVPVLHGYVLLRERCDKEYETDGKSKRLIDYADFRRLDGQPGLVIYDFQHKDEPYYEKVVSVMPYRYLGPKPGNRVFSEEEREHELLILEPSTLSRRTLTWAIRVSKGHGDNQRLRSADGRPSEHLAAGALRNSRLQCGRGCGHFAGGLSGPEIASPGPGKDIVDCALNMVRIWRGSPPHYGVMVRFHSRFGYDMAAASSRRWYGTGRF